MHIQKVLNSSVVLVQDDSGEESILLGKGIGYGRKAGEPIERQPSDRVFLPLSNPDAQPMLELFSSIPASYLELTQDIVDDAEQSLGVKLSAHIYLLLTDHLHFAVERQQKGLVVTNRIVQLVLLWTHASSLLQGSSALDWKKVLTNINMIAIAAGALLYWFRVVLPAPLQNTMSTVGNMMGPMGMLLAGMAIAEKPLREVFCTRRNYLPTVLRLVVCPLVVLVLLWVCHASSWVADGKNILMTVYLAAITPACATVTSMAQLYDRDAAHSSALYVLTTLLSIVSMPVMIGLFDLLL